MKVLSIQVGQPKIILYNNREVKTSIFKEAVNGLVKVKKLGLEGDTQSDLTVHGGQFKAVYAYPAEHFEYWNSIAPQHEFENGAFGENLTTTGLLETEVSIGDVYQIGSVVIKVTQPRFPCFKLGVKYDDNQMIKLFHDSLKSGIYFEVLEEGEFCAGDDIKSITKSGGMAIHDFTVAKNSNGSEVELIKRLITDPHLMDEWKEYFEGKLRA
ncbi:MOSC domain-containing protein [Marinoscillum pacificum]|uniref:MOSC domain-containing protein n=1 Tax=Marinoscillum pacificum TaxID=392723 RepID=UPI0021584FDC|nr:MOSC domain-containing protein [Marinoscillum pacificum]